MPAKLDHFRGFFGRMGRKTWRTRRDSGKSRFEGSGQPACILSLLATLWMQLTPNSFSPAGRRLQRVATWSRPEGGLSWNSGALGEPGAFSRRALRFTAQPPSRARTFDTNLARRRIKCHDEGHLRRYPLSLERGHRQRRTSEPARRIAAIQRRCAFTARYSSQMSRITIRSKMVSATRATSPANAKR
jgi:hypothetical protein